MLRRSIWKSKLAIVLPIRLRKVGPRVVLHALDSDGAGSIPEIIKIEISIMSAVKSVNVTWVARIFCGF